MTVGGMGFIPERLLMMMMIRYYDHKQINTKVEYTQYSNISGNDLAWDYPGA